MGPGVEQEWIKQARTHTHTWFMRAIEASASAGNHPCQILGCVLVYSGCSERMEEWVLFPGSLAKGFLSLVESGCYCSTLRNLLGHQVDVKPSRVAGLEPLVQMKGQGCFLEGRQR